VTDKTDDGGTVQAPPGFEEFVSGRGVALTRAAYLLTGDHHLAEDLVQAALAKAVLQWPRINGNPEAYVRRILFTQRNYWRRRRVTESLVASHEAGPGDGHDEATDRRLIVRRALNRLTPRQRAVLILRFYEDHTEVETAAVLGISVGTVKSQTQRALRRMRELSPELAEFAPIERGGHR
jgi:RNA polymerase sigma-70 factor (sigma-E family)